MCFLRCPGNEDDGAYYYTNDENGGFIFTDDCSNDKFEIRYVTGGSYSEVLGRYRVDEEPTTPSSISQEHKTYGVFYTALTIVMGGSTLLCAIVVSVVYSRGHSVGGLYAAALERHSYNGLYMEDDERSVDDHPGLVIMGSPTSFGRRNTRQVGIGSQIVSTTHEEMIYL